MVRFTSFPDLLAYDIPCGTKFLRVLIFAIFPAIRKNHFPKITITTNIFPAKIYSKVIFSDLNSLPKNLILRNCVCSITWGRHTVACFKKYVFLLHIRDKNENMINEKLGRINFWLNSFSGGLGDSVILANDVSKMTQLNNWLLPHLQSSDRSYWKLCFRASIHGWRSRTFHSYCDNKGPTVTIVRVGVYIFGGYNDNSWQCKSVR